MKIAIIIQTKKPEAAWNAFRLVVTARKRSHATKVFLMGDGVECEGLIHDKYNVDEQQMCIYPWVGKYFLVALVWNLGKKSLVRVVFFQQCWIV